MCDNNRFIIRKIFPSERQRWCECSLNPEAEDFSVHTEGEKQWLNKWHSSEKFVFVCEKEGVFCGKFDIPFTENGWTLWAPSVCDNEEAPTVMQKLCNYIASEAEKQDISPVEVILENSHHHFDLAKIALLNSDFSIKEEKIIVQHKLGEIPEILQNELIFKPASQLLPADFLNLCIKCGMDENDAQQLKPESIAAKHWIVAEHNSIPAGIALLEGVGRSTETLTNRHIGVVAEKRGCGFGKALFVYSLQQSRKLKATQYIGSTEKQNLAMRALFDSTGCEVIGERLVFSLE